MLNSKMTVVMLALVALIVCSSASASSLSDNWDFGDINGGYQTSSYPNYNGTGTYAQMSAYIGGQHKIDNCSVSFSPDYWYNYDDNGNFVSKTLQGYRVSEYISGRITVPLTLSDLGDQNQSNSFNARGLSLSENSWLNTYKSYYSYTDAGAGDKYELFSQAGSNINILNFDVRYAYGNYNEYTYGDGGGGMGIVGIGQDNTTYFNYNVTWYGDFAPGTLLSGMTAPTLGSSVPEPATMAMLAFGAMSVIVRRRRRRS